MQNPNRSKARKPIKANRKFKIVARVPRLKIANTSAITPNNTRSTQITPVKKPRKTPKIPQEECPLPIDIHLLSLVVQDYCMLFHKSWFPHTLKKGVKPWGLARPNLFQNRPYE
jgi:hypothetical protein